MVGTSGAGSGFARPGNVSHLAPVSGSLSRGPCLGVQARLFGRRLLVPDENVPSNLTAMAFGYKPKANFAVENEREISKAPKVDFGQKQK